MTSPESKQRIKIVVIVPLVACAYFAAGWLGLLVFAVAPKVTLIWLPAGIAVAALLRCGFRCWPGIFLGQLAVSLANGVPVAPAAAIAAGSVAGPLLAAWGLRRTGFHQEFDRRRDILLLGAAAALGTAVTATNGTAILFLAGLVPQEARLVTGLTWWVGDTMGVISAAPLLLIVSREGLRALLDRRGELLLCFGTLCATAWSVFVLNTGAWPLAFLPLPLIAWAALRFGTMGTSCALVLLSVSAGYGTAIGHGPFYHADPIRGTAVLWIFIATATVLGWLVATLHSELQRAIGIRLLLERALSDVSLGVLLADLDQRITYANAGFSRLTGHSEEELIGQNARMFQGPETDPKTIGQINKALRTDGLFDGEILNYRKDGTTFWKALSISPVRNDRGVMTGFLGIQRDVTARRAADEKLRESEARHRQMFEANPHPMWVHDIETLRFLAVNAATIAHYGYSREEFLAMTIDGLRPTGEMPTLFKSVEASDGGLDKSGVSQHRTKSGTRIYVELSSHALDFDGRRARVVLAHDVTERHRAEARSAGERAVLELLASGAPPSDVLNRLVRSYEEMFPESFYSVLLMDADGKHLRHGAAPSLPKAYCRAVDGAEIGPATGSCGTAAFTRRRILVADIATDPLWKDFRDVALAHGLRACWSMPVISSQDRVLGTFAVYYRQPQVAGADEIAALERGAHFASLAIERAQLFESLRTSQVRMETLVGNLPGMAYRCENDPGWTMSYVSDGCEAITGYRRDELQENRGVAYADLVHPEDRASLRIKRQSAFDARVPFQSEYRILDRSGAERWISERATGVYDAFGTLLFIDGFIQDITAGREAEIEREQLDRKMQETQKLESLGVLAGGIAHDFNNLLTGIIGNASMAGMDLPEDSPVQEYIGQINEASQRATDLCKQMLAYSGRGRFFVQRVDLGRLVEDTAQMLQISLSKKAVLRFHLEKNLPPIEADPTQMRQIMMNLIINASEAIGQRSGVIDLGTGLVRVDRDYLSGTMMTGELAEGEYVFLEVSDNGCGMSPETQARIFDPFFTTKFTGRGLGLAAVLGIVRGHKGAMKVDSEPGRGTTFKLLFPAATGPVDSAARSPAANAEWRGHGTVLLVDDEATIRTTVARMLRTMGFEPVPVADGRQAIETYRANPARFALVLLDLTMPHMDGEQTFAELRRVRDDVRVVLMSGFNQQEVLVRFTGKGLASFLQKPFTITALRDVMQGVLG